MGSSVSRRVEVMLMLRVHEAWIFWFCYDTSIPLCSGFSLLVWPGFKQGKDAYCL